MITDGNLQRLLALLLSVLVIAPRPSDASSSDSGTLTVGDHTNICIPPGTGNPMTYGFTSGLIGSYSPIGLTSGFSVASIVDIHYSCSFHGFAETSFDVTGFSANPDSQWLISITCNGVENKKTSAYAYNYTSGNRVGIGPSFSVFQVSLKQHEKLSTTSCAL